MTIDEIRDRRAKGLNCWSGAIIDFLLAEITRLGVLIAARNMEIERLKGYVKNAAGRAEVNQVKDW